MTDYQHRSDDEAEEFFRRGRSWRKLSLTLAGVAAFFAAIGAGTGLKGDIASQVAGAFALLAAITIGVGAAFDPAKKATKSFEQGADFEREKDYVANRLAATHDASLEELNNELEEIARRFEAVRKREVRG